jgi:hypothetical protein
MNLQTRLLMGLSAVFMAAFGLVASFIPAEVLVTFGVPPVSVLLTVVQITGALYLAFALLNWMARGVLIGGIYSRPLALANFLHFAVVAVTLFKAIPSMNMIAVILVTLAYAVFAAWFALVLFTHPVRNNNNEGKP